MSNSLLLSAGIDPWWMDAVFYHIYPLGLCGCPAQNDFAAGVVHRIEKLNEFWDHLHGLGINALYLGPLFESSRHGYDTADFFHVDRRLGDWRSLRSALEQGRRRGMRIVLDGVFHHVGRDFWAFQDLRRNGPSSPYRNWFSGVDFGRPSPLGDPFTYDAWEGHSSLVKLNLENDSVKGHLFEAIRHWVERLDIDGLRLDVAYCLNRDFLSELAGFCRGLKRGFWLLGEMIHGDYRVLVHDGLLDSATNYECYKGLYSSHNDLNYFEIAYSLNRLFGEQGMYRDLMLYNFADNHDVSRIASLLKKEEHLYPLHVLLFAMPGIPSVYYGSEWGIRGEKSRGDDSVLRPSLDLASAAANSSHRDLAPAIRRLAEIRRGSRALRCGDYRQLHLTHQQLAFSRRWQDDEMIVVANSAAQAVSLDIPLPSAGGTYRDVLNPGHEYRAWNGHLRVEKVPSNWGCLLQRLAG